MIRDQKSTFIDGLSLIGLTGAVVSQNILDTGAPNTIGRGSPEPVYLALALEDAVVPGTATIAVAFESSEDVAFTAPVSVQLQAATAASGLVDGVQFKLPFTTHRYTRVVLTLTGTITAGSVSAFLTKDPSYQHAYPTAIGSVKV